MMTGPPPRIITYRPDIDGLRALSVIAVVLYHAGVPGVAGGFAGVDVFFVISGYLITRLLLAPSEASFTQRLREFYLRRGRRILPALLVLLVASTALALWLLLPVDLMRYGRYLKLASLGLANVAAWADGDYFSPGSTSPLLHLWSIAVEEQFYLVYPWALAGLLRLPRRLRAPMLVAASGVSLALWLWGSVHSPYATFYFVPTRAWELLAGACVAFGIVPRVNRGAVNELIAVVAVAAIVLTFCCTTDDRTRAAGFAMLPTLATAALLLTGESGSRVAALLALRPLVFIGLISYSLYLWHMPLFAFVRYWNVAPLTGLQQVSLVAAAFALAALSWRWIELPVRSGRTLRSNPLFVGVMFAALAVLGLIGLWIARSNGSPQRFGSTERAILAAADPHDDPTYPCFTLSQAKLAAGELCHDQPIDERLPKVVLWGDSHAGRSRYAFDKLAWERGYQLYFGAHMSCRPLIGVVSPRTRPGEAALCDRFNLGMIEAVKRLDPKLVIFDSFWLHPDQTYRITPELNVATGDSPFSRGLQAMLAQIRAPGRRVCMVLGTPVTTFHVPYALVMAQRRGIDLAFFDIPSAGVLREHAAIDGDARALEQRGLLRTVDPKKLMCGGGLCRYTDATGAPLYYDNNHLTLSGAAVIAPELAHCFDSMTSSADVRPGS
jgi:peptidoglycan/LPS O-acetylase OafA/YrhL